MGRQLFKDVFTAPSMLPLRNLQGI
eukprot:SAG11_NODE_20322_length_448_cov_0.690544_1_plen_24_part_01